MQEALQLEKLGQYAVTADLEGAAHGKFPASGLVSVPRNAATASVGDRPLYRKDDTRGKRKAQKQTGHIKNKGHRSDH